jgi:hypothetical protein
VFGIHLIFQDRISALKADGAGFFRPVLKILHVIGMPFPEMFFWDRLWESERVRRQMADLGMPRIK